MYSVSSADDDGDGHGSLLWAPMHPLGEALQALHLHVMPWWFQLLPDFTSIPVYIENWRDAGTLGEVISLMRIDTRFHLLLFGGRIVLKYLCNYIDEYWFSIGSILPWVFKFLNTVGFSSSEL